MCAFSCSRVCACLCPACPQDSMRAHGCSCSHLCVHRQECVTVTRGSNLYMCDLSVCASATCTCQCVHACSCLCTDRCASSPSLSTWTSARMWVPRARSGARARAPCVHFLVCMCAWSCAGALRAWAVGSGGQPGWALPPSLCGTETVTFTGSVVKGPARPAVNTAIPTSDKYKMHQKI